MDSVIMDVAYDDNEIDAGDVQFLEWVTKQIPGTIDFGEYLTAFDEYGAWLGVLAVRTVTSQVVLDEALEKIRLCNVHFDDRPLQADLYFYDVDYVREVI